MLLLTYAINPLLMIALPIVLGLVLAARLKASWRLFFIGAVTFIASQIGHLPFNALLENGLHISKLPLAVYAVILGLSAGVFEEVARYLVYRFWIKDARHWSQALMFGAGHGGVEAVIVGALAALGAINILVLSQRDLNTLGLPADQLTLVQEQMAVALSYPWWYPLLGTIERVTAICTHLTMAVLVVQVFKRRNLLWLLAAILWHAAVDATAVYAIGTLGAENGAVWVEIIIGLFALAGLGVIWLLREPPLKQPEVATVPLAMAAATPLTPTAPTAESLDKTRYQ
ncbi:MAG: YhfC family intramembrane metalloprotease [Anaerolineales bacterium]|nr:YhfC family intramembrane metalloprotease [Anaerolineales bacterium]